MKILTVATDINRIKPLVDSLEKLKYDYHIIQTEWRGFGTKLLSVRNYLISHPEVEYFIFCDAYDVVAMRPLSEFPKDKIIFSAEKNCWPIPDLAKDYPESKTPYKYLNSGLYYAPSKMFLALFEFETPEYISDDQLWATRQFLFNEKSGIEIDTMCSVFQSYSFIDEGEYKYLPQGVLNTNTCTYPSWFHGNGTTNMDKLYELI